MKMKYVKPAMCIERYTLTESIASGCETNGLNSSFGKHTYQDGNSCTWQDYGISFPIFTDVNSKCQIWDDEYEMGCYNNPSGEPQLFGS